MKNAFESIEGIKKRTAIVFFIIDQSGSMSGKKIGSVNHAMGESIPEMPIAYKEGSIFLGWYTSKYGTQSPNSGQLTDLTPITRDLTVYACFEEIAP